MSDNFRIFVTEKEIVIQKFTIKTPRRWAKRQRDMRIMRMRENTIKDLSTLNRGQSMLFNLYIKGYTLASLTIYQHEIELIVYAKDMESLSVAETIILNFWEDGDYSESNEQENEDGPFAYYKWRGHLLETENE